VDFQQELEMELKVIKTEEDYDAAINELRRLIDLHPASGTAEADRLDVLSILVEKYEEKNFVFDLPDPVSAIKFVMDQRNLTRDDLVPYLGSRSRVSEVLSGKRELSKKMMRTLHKELGIPAEILLQELDAEMPEEVDLQWERFPLAEMRKCKYRWFPEFSGTLTKMIEYAEDLISPKLMTLQKHCASPLMPRSSATNYRGEKQIDEYSLSIWQASTVELAVKDQLDVKFSKNTCKNLLQNIACLSVFPEGPLLARHKLNQHGIHLIILPHLSKTYLDGAAMVLKDGSPVIGLTLRHDRLDNFWFSLMHELVHVIKHLSTEDKPYFDDFDKTKNVADVENEADKIAENNLIPSDQWNCNDSENMYLKGNPEIIRNKARELNIDPSILAGRIRHDIDYKRFHGLLGKGIPRRLFGLD
jgi:HTH-type transcriptional regulator/antitoxin HigA